MTKNEDTGGQTSGPLLTLEQRAELFKNKEEILGLVDEKHNKIMELEKKLEILEADEENEMWLEAQEHALKKAEEIKKEHLTEIEGLEKKLQSARDILASSPDDNVKKIGEILESIEVHMVYKKAFQETIEKLQKEVERLKEALREISKGKGRFNRDNHIHATNTIEDMKVIALKALEEDKKEYKADIPKDPEHCIFIKDKKSCFLNLATIGTTVPCKLVEGQDCNDYSHDGG